MYDCKRCGYKTEYKQSLIRHLNRAKPCDETYDTTPREAILKELQRKHDSESIHTCVYCNAEFTFKNNMFRHQKNCKKKVDNSEINELKEQMKQMALQLEELKLNGTHTVNNTNNVQNNIINIQLKDFGLESQAHLTTEFLNKCFADKGLVSLIENLHFDQEAPQNHNVRLRSRKQELMEVFSHGKWLVKDQDQTLTELIQSGYRILRMHGKRNKENIMEEEGIDEVDYDEIVQWLETIYEDRKVQKPIKRDLIILFMNNQAMLLGRDRDD
jgi:hypothetical protein